MDLPFVTRLETIGGFIVFSICAGYGLRLLYQGLRGDIYDVSGTRRAGRAWFILGGIACLIPLGVYSWFLWRHGYFG